MTGGDAKSVEVVTGATADASLILKPALYFTGKVVDEQGGPISAVKFRANVAFGRSSGGVESTASKSDGSFELFNYSVQPSLVKGDRARDTSFSSIQIISIIELKMFTRLVRTSPKPCGLSSRPVIR